MENVKCLISDAPSISINSFFENVSKEIFKENSSKIAYYAKKSFNKEFKCNINDFECLEIVKNSKYPILLSAGSNENMQDILNAIKNNNPNETEIIILPGCNHGNGMYKQTSLYQSKIKEFIEKHLK
jgi:sialic acid synthase SpsE